MADILPQLQYLIAFQNNAMDDPALITSVAAPGVLGANNVWTDITHWVLSDDGERGRQHELSQFEAGTRSLTLQNNDGRFTSWKAGAPYSGFLVPRKPFQVRAIWSGTTYTRFTGQVDSWGMSWPDQAQQQVALHVTDAFRVFNLADITSGGYPAQVVADGASGYYRLGDAAPTLTAVDSSGNGANGVYMGTVTLGGSGALTSNTGSSCDFGSTGYVQFPPGATTTTSTYSIEAWVNVSAWSGATMMVVDWYSSTTTAEVQLYVDASGILHLDHFGPSGLFFHVRGLTAIGVNGWHYVVVTRTGTTCTMYLDGTAMSTATVGTVTNTAGLVADNASIGAYLINGVGPVFPGSLQEVALYPSVLSSTQVTNHWQLAAWPQESTDSRVNRVLNTIGWSSGARALDTGKSTVQANTTSLTTTSSLSHLQSVEATEGGALFMTTDGKVRLYSRTSLQSAAFTTANQAQFGDATGSGDIPFMPAPTLAIDDIDLYNEASASRSGGNTQITDNAASILANGRNTWQPPATLIGISDAEVLAETQYVVTKYSTPVNRLGSITVDLAALATSFPLLVPTLLLLDLLYQVTAERTHMPGGGTSFSQTADIEHISESITPNSWTITFGMEISDPGWWILGSGALGSTTSLAW